MAWPAAGGGVVRPSSLAAWHMARLSQGTRDIESIIMGSLEKVGLGWE